MINHINVADAEGKVYCCLRNRIVCLDEEHKNKFCSGCKMYNGNAGGGGVECIWDDIREADANQVIVTDPAREWASNQMRRVQTLMTEWNTGQECIDNNGASF